MSKITSAALIRRHTFTHGNAAFSAAYHPNGKLMATGSLDNTVKLWSLPAGEHVGTVRGHGDGIGFVGYLSDGRLVTASFDKTLRIWNGPPLAPKPETVFSGHQNFLETATISPSGTMLASCAFDNTVRLWSVNSGGSIAVFTEHTGAVHSVSFSRDSKILASGSDDTTVRLWSTETKKPVGVIAAHSSPVEAVAFSPQEDLLASSGVDIEIRLWKLNGEKVGAFKAGKLRTKSLAFSPDGTLLASGCSEGFVRIWDVKAGKELTSSKLHTNAIYGLIFRSDGKQVVSSSYDRTICVADLALK